MTIKTLSPTRRPRRLDILLLFVVHVVSVVIAASCSADTIAVSSAIFLSMIFAQSCLLGIWGGIGNSPWIVRIFGLATGNVLLYYVLASRIGYGGGETFLVVTTSTTATVVPMWLLRIFCVQLRFEIREDTFREGLQFSIGHVMLLTTAVAALLVTGKIMARYMQHVDQVTELVTLGLCYVSTALVACWATLGLANPWARVPIALLVALGAGLVGTYALGEVNDIAFWMSTFLLQVSLVVGTLLATRHFGYRLVARSRLSDSVS